MRSIVLLHCRLEIHLIFINANLVNPLTNALPFQLYWQQTMFKRSIVTSSESNVNWAWRKMNASIAKLRENQRKLLAFSSWCSSDFVYFLQKKNIWVALLTKDVTRIELSHQQSVFQITIHLHLLTCTCWSLVKEGKKLVWSETCNHNIANKSILPSPEGVWEFATILGECCF